MSSSSPWRNYKEKEEEDEAEEARVEYEEDVDALEVMLPMKAAMQLAVDTALTLLEIDGLYTPTSS